jgi:hypothetical protein
MNFKRILVVGAIALIGLATPAAYAGFRHHHHTSVAIGIGFSSFPSWGYGYYPYNYSGYYPYGYGYYPYGYYPYGSSYSSYSSYPYSYGYSSYRPGYRGEVGHRSVVVQVQERLARAGYYHGRIDGVMGSQTHSAVRAYQRAHNLRVDGAINDQLLGTMRLR